MSFIHLFIILIFLEPIVSLTAPQVVYSATISNQRTKNVRCRANWVFPSGDRIFTGVITIEKHGKYYLPEKSTREDGWISRAVIEKVSCGRLTLRAPFSGVDSPTSTWTFAVYPNEIISRAN